MVAGGGGGVLFDLMSLIRALQQHCPTTTPHTVTTGNEASSVRSDTCSFPEADERLNSASSLLHVVATSSRGRLVLVAARHSLSLGLGLQHSAAAVFTVSHWGNK